jgi:hypothetical protein
LIYPRPSLRLRGGRRYLICALFRRTLHQQLPAFAEILAMKIGPVSVHRHRPHSLDGYRLSGLYRVTLLPRTISLLKYSGRVREGWPSRMVHSNAERKSSRPHVDIPLGVPKSVSPAQRANTLASFRESLRTRLYSSVLIITATAAAVRRNHRPPMGETSGGHQSASSAISHNDRTNRPTDGASLAAGAGILGHPVRPLCDHALPPARKPWSAKPLPVPACSSRRSSMAFAP